MSNGEGSKPRGTYHHGDLRRALVEGAAAIIAEEGSDALTLRGVGQRVGVSRTALYRHFDSKAALLAAVAREGFRLLRADLEAAHRGALADGTEPILAQGEAYVGFGAKHPAYYRTMFGPTLQDREQCPALIEEGREAFGVLVRAIAEGQAAGRLTPGDPVRLAQVLWALVHGVVTLGADGHFVQQGPGAEPTPGPVLASFAAATALAGLLVRPAPSGAG